MIFLREVFNDPRYKGNLFFFLISYFFVLFNYPLVRASSTAMFLEEFGAKSSPVAWFFTVLALSGTIFVFNRFQARHSVQSVFFWASLLSLCLFTSAFWGFNSQIKYASAFSFIWKEIYIVIQIHLLLAYANNFFKKEHFKILIGPVGAIGSVGGILGGGLTTYLAKKFDPSLVSWMSLIFIILPAGFFYLTPKLKTDGELTQESPLETLNTPEIKKYVFSICVLVMLSQFIINIADFKFNLALESELSSASERTSFLGKIYSITNLISLIFQFLLLPFLLRRFSEHRLHYFVPISYIFFLLTGYLFSFQFLTFISAFYLYLKASDYSLFSGLKELLYQVLKPEQKYGTKYLTDMLVYRASKAFIAVVLIYVQSSLILDMLMLIFLILWPIFIKKIFTLQKQIL